MKKVFLNKTIKYYLLVMIPLVAIELIFRAVLAMPLLDWAVWRIFLGINVLSLLLGILFSFCKPIIAKILNFIVIIVSTIYALLQAGFINYLGVFMSFGTTSQAGAVKSYIKDYLGSFHWQFYLILIPFVLFLLYQIFIEKRLKVLAENQLVNVLETSKKTNQKEKIVKEKELLEKKKNNITRAICLLIAIFLGVGYYLTLTLKFMQNELQLISSKELFRKPSEPNLTVAQFGINIFALLDLKEQIIPSASAINGETNHYEKPTQEQNDYTRYIDDSAWDKVIASTTQDNNFKRLNDYFYNRNITPKNEKTGVFAGKNLVVIQLESVNDIILNETYFPTIAKLYNEGWAWVNNYSPRNACSTANNEISAMMSLFTINRSCTANAYKGNVYPQAIFNLFNKSGYKTSSYHDYTEAYYRRKTIHPNMGVNKFYGVTDLGMKYNPVYEEWPNDEEFVERAMDVFLNANDSTPFMAWLVTVSSHQPYTVDSENGSKYFDLFKDTNYPTSLKRYMSKLKIVDDALAKLLEGLTNAGKLDDTVIMLFDDHYPYGLTENTINKALNYDVTVNNEVDRTPFIIYNPGITAQKFETYTSYMNILPTIANLFDLDFDPRLYAGHDLFDADYPNRTVFADGSWQSPIGFYNATTGKISYSGEETYKTEEIVAINKEITTLIKMSNLAITTNYFKKLYSELEKYQQSAIEVPESVEPQIKKEEQDIPE